MDSFSYSKSDQAYLRRLNVGKVLSLLRRHRTLSRVELSALAKLDKKTVTNIVNELLQAEQVRVVSQSRGGLGRPKSNLTINGAYCFFLGLDLGGTHITGVIVDFADNIRETSTIELKNDMMPEAMLDLAVALLNNLIQKSGLPRQEIKGLGISVPGFVDQSTGRSVMSENLYKWNDVPLRDFFQARLGIEVFIDDCSRLMALAEMILDDDQSCRDYVVVDLGLGVGCGIIINRKLYMGSNGKSGELGHTTVQVDGPLCTCGRFGCIESLASGWALSRMAEDALRVGVETQLRNLVGEAAPTPKDIVNAANQGDAYCFNLIKRAGRFIGIGVASAISFFNPAKVIIGGRLIKNNDILFSTITQTIEEGTMPQLYADTLVKRSVIGDCASAIGAALYCQERGLGEPDA